MKKLAWILSLAGCLFSGCAKTVIAKGDVVICTSCIPAGCRAVVTPDGKVSYEKIAPKN